MRPGPRMLLAITLLAPALAPGPEARGDEPGRSGLGRLFRLGSGSATPAPPPGPRPSPVYGPAAPPPSSAASQPIPPALIPPAATTTTTTTTAPATAAEAGSRLVPQPRVSRAATEADPILTRISIGRADDGKRFGMFLQVYADGTVIDSEGIHRLAPEALRPLVDALHASDASRLQGHCGGPPTDFIEQVYLTVYERKLGRLVANSFSYSGNTQGCSHQVHQLQAAIEALVVKLNGPATAAPAASTPAPAAPAPSAGTAIPLTPLE